MTFNFVFVSVALVAVVMAGPGEHGKPEHGVQGKGQHGGPHGGPHGAPHGGPPVFLANVSAEGKKEFEAVFRNENLTLAQIDNQVATLAEKYGVSALYKEFEANRTAHLAEIKKNTTAVIGNLSSVAAQLATIYQNKDQTRKAQHDAVDAIRKEHRVEVDAVQFIRAQFGERQHGRGGPHGGPHGGKPHGKEHGKQNGGHRGEKNGKGEHGKNDKETKQ